MNRLLLPLLVIAMAALGYSQNVDRKMIVGKWSGGYEVDFTHSRSDAGKADSDFMHKLAKSGNVSFKLTKDGVYVAEMTFEGQKNSAKGVWKLSPGNMLDVTDYFRNGQPVSKDKQIPFGFKIESVSQKEMRLRMVKMPMPTVVVLKRQSK